MTVRVVVADNNTTSRDVISAALARAGMQVHAARSGGEGLALFLKARPHVVIYDEDLSELGGAALCDHVKQVDPSVRVVLVGAERGDTERLELIGALNLDAILRRPFRYADFESLLAAWGLMSALTVAEQSRSNPVSFAVPSAAPPSISFGTEYAGSTATRVVIPAMPQPAPGPAASAPPAPAAVELPELRLEEIEIIDPKEVEAELQRLTVPASGSLPHYPLPRLLFELYTATFTGALHLKRQGVERTLYLRAGLVVRVDSHLLSENLGRMLVQHGRITEAQYAEAQEIQFAEGVRQGDALMQIGAVDELMLLNALAEQTAEKLANSFAWRDGEYSLEVMKHLPASLIISEVSPIDGIWRGVSEHYDLPSLETFFQPFRDHYLVTTASFSMHFGTLGSHLQSLGLQSVLDGHTTVAAALNSFPNRRLPVAQAVYVLMVVDMLRPSARPGTAPSSEIERPAEPPPPAPDEGELAGRIAREYMRLKTANYFSALGVPPSADAQQVQSAFDQLRRHLCLDDLPQDLPPVSRQRAREIRDILARAARTLSNTEMRDLYRDALGLPREPALTSGVTGDLRSGEAVEMDRVLAGERAYLKGRALMEAGKLPQARTKFHQAIEHHNSEPTYRVALGRAILLEGVGGDAAARRDAAICFRQALQLDPAHIEANLQLARLFILVGNAAQARPLLDMVLRRSPEHPEALELLRERA